MTEVILPLASYLSKKYSLSPKDSHVKRTEQLIKDIQSDNNIVFLSAYYVNIYPYEDLYITYSYPSIDAVLLDKNYLSLWAKVGTMVALYRAGRYDPETPSFLPHTLGLDIPNYLVDMGLLQSNWDDDNSVPISILIPAVTYASKTDTYNPCIISKQAIISKLSTSAEPQLPTSKFDEIFPSTGFKEIPANDPAPTKTPTKVPDQKDLNTNKDDLKEEGSLDQPNINKEYSDKQISEINLFKTIRELKDSADKTVAATMQRPLGTEEPVVSIGDEGLSQIDSELDDIFAGVYLFDLGGVPVATSVQNIRTSRSINVGRAQALRDCGSDIFNLGDIESYLEIDVFFFEDDLAAFNSLGLLLLLFKNMPITYIYDNDYINNTLEIRDVALIGLSVQTVPGFAGLYKATITMAPMKYSHIAFGTDIKSMIFQPAWNAYWEYLLDKHIIPDFQVIEDENRLAISQPKTEFLQDTLMQLYAIDTALQTGGLLFNSTDENNVWSFVFPKDKNKWGSVFNTQIIDSTNKEKVKVKLDALNAAKETLGSALKKIQFYRNNRWQSILDQTKEDLVAFGIDNIGIVDASDGKAAGNSLYQVKNTELFKFINDELYPRLDYILSNSDINNIISVLRQKTSFNIMLDIIGSSPGPLTSGIFEELFGDIGIDWFTQLKQDYLFNEKEVTLDLLERRISIGDKTAEEVITNGLTDPKSIIKRAVGLYILLQICFAARGIVPMQEMLSEMSILQDSRLPLAQMDSILPQDGGSARTNVPGLVGALLALYDFFTLQVIYFEKSYLAPMSTSQSLVANLFDISRYKMGNTDKRYLSESYIQQISIQYYNRFATIYTDHPGHIYPVYQFIGGGETQAQISILTTSENEIEGIRSELDMVQENAKYYATQIPAGFVRIYEPLLNAMDMEEVIITNFECSNVDNFAETFQYSIVMERYDLKRRNKVIPISNQYANVFADQELADIDKIDGTDEKSIAKLYWDWDCIQARMNAECTYPDLDLPQFGDICNYPLSLEDCKKFDGVIDQLIDSMKEFGNSEAQNAIDGSGDRFKVWMFETADGFSNKGSTRNNGTLLDLEKLAGEKKLKLGHLLNFILAKKLFPYRKHIKNAYNLEEFMDPDFYLMPIYHHPWLYPDTAYLDGATIGQRNQSGTIASRDTSDLATVVETGGRDMTGPDADAEVIDNAQEFVSTSYYLDPVDYSETERDLTNTDPAAGGFKYLWMDHTLYNHQFEFISLFPTFHITLIDEMGWICGWKAMDNTYGSSRILELSVNSSKNRPADTAMIKMLNTWGDLQRPEISPNLVAQYAVAFRKLPDDIWQEFKDTWTHAEEYISKISGPLFAQALAEYIAFKAYQSRLYTSLFLKPGTRISIRMGYGSNPARLPLVFNGKITDINTGQILDIVAQGDGIELTPAFGNVINIDTAPWTQFWEWVGVHMGGKVFKAKLNQKVDSAPFTWTIHSNSKNVYAIICRTLTSKGPQNILMQWMEGLMEKWQTLSKLLRLFKANPWGIEHFGYSKGPAVLESVDTGSKNIIGDALGTLLEGGTRLEFDSGIFDKTDAEQFPFTEEINNPPIPSYIHQPSGRTGQTPSDNAQDSRAKSILDSFSSYIKRKFKRDEYIKTHSHYIPDLIIELKTTNFYYYMVTSYRGIELPRCFKIAQKNISEKVENLLISNMIEQTEVGIAIMNYLNDNTSVAILYEFKDGEFSSTESIATKSLNNLQIIPITLNRDEKNIIIGENFDNNFLADRQNNIRDANNDNLFLKVRIYLDLYYSFLENNPEEVKKNIEIQNIPAYNNYSGIVIKELPSDFVNAYRKLIAIGKTGDDKGQTSFPDIAKYSFSDTGPYAITFTFNTTNNTILLESHSPADSIDKELAFNFIKSTLDKPFGQLWGSAGIRSSDLETAAKKFMEEQGIDLSQFGKETTFLSSLETYLKQGSNIDKLKISPGLFENTGIPGYEDATLNIYPGFLSYSTLTSDNTGTPETLSIAEVEEKFGKAGTRDSQWYKDNIEILDVSDLLPQNHNITGPNNSKWDGKLEVNKHIRFALSNVFREILTRPELASLLLDVDECYNYRKATGSDKLSKHSWGIAIDINPLQNGYNKTPAAIGELGSVRELVAIFEKHGFYWGGNWNTQDGMHFVWGIGDTEIKDKGD